MFCVFLFFLESFSTHLTYQCFKCLLHMNKHIYEVASQRYQDSRHLFQNPKNHQSVMGFSNRAQRFTTPYYLDVDSPFQPVHINSTSSLGQTSASHFASTIALVLANLGPLVLASSLMRSRAPSFVKSRASESVETRAHRSCVYRQCILVSNLRPGR